MIQLHRTQTQATLHHWKNLDSVANIVSVQETGSILKIGFSLSKRPYFNRAYLVTVGIHVRKLYKNVKSWYNLLQNVYLCSIIACYEFFWELGIKSWTCSSYKLNDNVNSSVVGFRGPFLYLMKYKQVLVWGYSKYV